MKRATKSGNSNGKEKSLATQDTSLVPRIEFESLPNWGFELKPWRILAHLGTRRLKLAE